MAPLYIFWRLLKIAWTSAYKNNVFESAKGVAYSALFSFFPVITTIAALLVELQANVTQRMMSSFLYRVAPPGTEDVVKNLFIVHGQRPKYLLAVAVALAAWAASSAISSLMGGFQLAYRLRSRPFFRDRAVALGLVFASVIPLFVACGLVIFGEWLERWLLSAVPLFHKDGDLSKWALAVGEIVAYLIAFCALVFVTALLYYAGPNCKQSFERVIPGAILATSLCLLSTFAVGWYLRHVTNYNVLYGSVGAGLALLLWMYILALIAFFGCEFNAACDRAYAAAREIERLQPVHS